MAQADSDPNQTHDVIIAGASPAGCVLANRLSAHAHKSVLLLEAGPDIPPGGEHPDILDPFPLSLDNPAFHWPGLTVEMGADLGTGAARATRPYIKGYGVGGGSNVNGMAADRGQPGDYDTWGSLGAAGWSWESVLPYFKKMERDLDFSQSNALLHGNCGPMPVHRLPPRRWAPFAAALSNALQQRGFEVIEDYMTDFRDGVSGTPTNSLPEGRVSASMAYLTSEVRRRPNLTIWADTRVDRVSLAEGRANGVFIHRNGIAVLARGRQIIVSCGGLHSPAVLMRSGIGPAEQLAHHGIELVRDRRGVGANLQNHTSVALTTYLPQKAFQPADNPWFLQNWLRFSSKHPGCAPHDMHLMPFNRSAWHALGRRVGRLAATVLQPHSKGSVELSSSDPAATPKTRFNILADSRDRERLVAALRLVLELLTEPGVTAMRRDIFIPDPRIVANLARHNRWNAFKAHAIARVLDRAPLRERLLARRTIDPYLLLGDANALEDFVLRNARPQIHDCGTCRMGRAGDADAVVDGVGRVLGVDALRVVDASIFPTIPRGYPHFIVLMTAEKIADAITAEG